MAFPQRYFRSYRNFCGDRKYEKTPFVIGVAVIVITNAMKPVGRNEFRLVTRGTSQCLDHIGGGSLLRCANAIGRRMPWD